MCGRRVRRQEDALYCAFLLSYSSTLSSPSDSATPLLFYVPLHHPPVPRIVPCSIALPMHCPPLPAFALFCPPLSQPLVRIPGGGQLFSTAASLLRSTTLGPSMRSLTRFLLPYVRPVVTTIPFYLCGVEFEPLFYRCVTGEERQGQRGERGDMHVGTHETHTHHVCCCFCCV